MSFRKIYLTFLFVFATGEVLFSSETDSSVEASEAQVAGVVQSTPADAEDSSTSETESIDDDTDVDSAATGSDIIEDEVGDIQVVDVLTEAAKQLAPAIDEVAELPVIVKEAPSGMVYVAGGSKTIGDSDKQLKVQEFFIGKYEVTFEEWQKVQVWARGKGYDLDGTGDGCGDDHPVHSLSWYDAIKWCNARSEMEGLTPIYYTDEVHQQVFRSGLFALNESHLNLEANGYRLPNLSEWLFAAYGGNKGSGYPYSGGNEPDEVGWFVSNSHGADTNLAQGCGTWPVGLKQPNELGIYDMSGNVWEWVWDADQKHRFFRIAMGGGWFSGTESTQLTEQRIAHPTDRYIARGFRVVRSVAQISE